MFPVPLFHEPNKIEGVCGSDVFWNNAFRDIFKKENEFT